MLFVLCNFLSGLTLKVAFLLPACEKQLLSPLHFSMHWLEKQVGFAEQRLVKFKLMSQVTLNPVM